MRAKLLLLDDDDAVLEYLRIKLGARYDLVLSSDSGEVMDLARKERPDLILCDIDMPGMDGGDVSAALFADDATRDIPLLFLSVLVEAQNQVGGRHAISKNAPVAELTAKIESILKG